MIYFYILFVNELIQQCGVGRYVHMIYLPEFEIKDMAGSAYPGQHKTAYNYIV